MRSGDQPPQGPAPHSSLDQDLRRVKHYFRGTKAQRSLEGQLGETGVCFAKHNWGGGGA